jgi:hypothetical protein
MILRGGDDMNKIQARLAMVDKATMQGVTTQTPAEIRVHKGIRRVVLDLGDGRMVMQLDRGNATELVKQIAAICLAMPKPKE